MGPFCIQVMPYKQTEPTGGTTSNISMLIRDPDQTEQTKEKLFARASRITPEHQMTAPTILRSLEIPQERTNRPSPTPQYRANENDESAPDAGALSAARRLATAQLRTGKNHHPEPTLDEWTAVTWPGGIPGSAQEDMAYITAQLQGYTLTFSLEEPTATVHTDSTGKTAVVPMNCLH